MIAELEEATANAVRQQHGMQDAHECLVRNLQCQVCATHCNTLQHTVILCNALQHTATTCSSSTPCRTHANVMFTT